VAGGIKEPNSWIGALKKFGVVGAIGIEGYLIGRGNWKERGEKKMCPKNKHLPREKWHGLTTPFSFDRAKQKGGTIGKKEKGYSFGM